MALPNTSKRLRPYRRHWLPCLLALFSLTALAGWAQAGGHAPAEVQPTLLYHFPNKYANSYLERDGALVQGGDGTIVIVTTSSLYLGCGQVLALEPGTGQVSQIKIDKTSIGCQPQPDLAVDTQGTLWGLTRSKGPGQHGSVFALANDHVPTLIHAYSAEEGYAGQTLLSWPDGSLRVARASTAQSSYGQLERLAPPDFEPQPIYPFDSRDPVRVPYVLATQGQGGLYGLALNNPGDGGSSLVSLGGAVPPRVIAPLRAYGRLAASLVDSGMGSFYVAAAGDGQADGGQVLSVRSTGEVTVLHLFDGTAGRTPLSAPVPAPDGWLYGSTARGGAQDLGVLYRLRPDGSDYQLLYSFDGEHGSTPRAALLLAADGQLYGRTVTGGKHSNGVVFRFALPADTQP